MKQLLQIRNHAQQIFPWPEPEQTLVTTPPAFRWLPVDGAAPYTVVVRCDGVEVLRISTCDNFLLPRQRLAPGRYSWNIYSASLDAQRGEYYFEIAADATDYLVPTAAALLAALPATRPRHIFTSPSVVSEILQRTVPQQASLRRTIALALQQGLPQPPRFHRDPSALPYREAFGKHREFVDRNLVACALGHLLLHDKAAAGYVRDCLLTICDWNPEGPCSVQGKWGDEFGLSHARCLPAVYDWTADLFDDSERDYIERTLAQYARQTAERLRRLQFAVKPGNSHAGRLPAYLGEAALVLHGSAAVGIEETHDWLNFALDIFGAIFPFYGGRDGGWAEGPFYGSSYTKWFQPFFFAVEQLADFSFFEQPFYRQVSQFFLHCGQPQWECRPFSDGYWCGPEDPEWPGFCAQDPFGVYAERFGPPLARQLAAQCQPQTYMLHLLDVFRPARQPLVPEAAGPACNSRWFRDAGYVSIHQAIQEPDNDIALLARASRYGTASHQHADQGNFAIVAAGKMLCGPSGYFGRRHGSSHHRDWTRQTQAHNCILVDGEGQQWGSHLATAQILALEEAGAHATALLDLANAYPMLDSYRRQLSLDRTARQITIVDAIVAPQPVTVSWLLHTLSPPRIDNAAVIIDRGPCSCRLSLQAASPTPVPTVTDQWAVDVNQDVPPAYWVTMPKQYHLRWDFQAASCLRIVATFELS